MFQEKLFHSNSSDSFSGCGQFLACNLSFSHLNEDSFFLILPNLELQQGDS
jgi:hypothetical protein